MRYTPIDSQAQHHLTGGIYDMAELGEHVVLSQQEQQRIQGLLQPGTDELRAKYKLEVVFGSTRSSTRPFPGMVFAWSNGGFNHGGGDEKIYFCPQPVTAKDGETRMCGAVIDLRFVDREHGICQTCRRVCKPRELVGEIYANLPLQHWAALLTKMFVKLENNADIRIMTAPQDIRMTAVKEQQQARAGEDLDNIRLKRYFVIYTLENIVKDTANSSDLYSRLKAFLSA